MTPKPKRFLAHLIYWPLKIGFILFFIFMVISMIILIGMDISQQAHVSKELFQAIVGAIVILSGLFFIVFIYEWAKGILQK